VTDAVVLDGRLDAATVLAVATGARVELDPDALTDVAACREVLDRLVAAGTPIYGITTGFGALVSERVAPEFQRRLQVDLLRSHAAGTGAELPREVVRAAMAIRVSSLLRGYSGVRPIVPERVVALLNADLVPRVPRSGSLGASGDLAPSAHAFLPLIGEGEVVDRAGRTLSGAQALERLGLEPLALETKEGLALINGTHFMAAIGALLMVRAATLLDTIDVVCACTLDALRGATPAFDDRVHAVRSLRGQIESAANVLTALRGSARVSGPGGARLQDAYSLRCAAQVHGAAREAVAFFDGLVETDLNAVTDNPLVFGDPEPAVISAGNFHGQSLALAFDTLRLAIADLGSISERRTFRLVSPSLNGVLPAFLSPTPGPSSGYMIAQYSAAALVAELRALAHPVSVDNVPASDNQEDHVSMGMTAAVMALEAIERLERVVAFELLCACQALDLDPDPPGYVVAMAHAAVRQHVAPLGDDRPPADDARAVEALVREGALAHLLAGARAREQVTV
jgi:histidine ammonia-lyase